MKAISTKYHGATDTKGSRISARDCDGNRVFVSHHTALGQEDSHKRAVRALMEKMGWDGELIGGYVGSGMVWVFDSPSSPQITVAKVDEVPA